MLKGDRLILRAVERGDLARLHELKTSSANERALRCYQAAGFVEEGRMREQLYFDGRYVDSVLMGLLRREWQARQGVRV